MTYLLSSLLLLLLFVARPCVAKPPHIIHILADDYGWADVGYHRSSGGNGSHSDVQTPNIDALARGGIELDRFYIHKICSPSRCSLQTGRAPIHVNVQNVAPECSNKLDSVGGYQGIPLNMTGIASHMKRAGYRTHMVGKWDVGMATPGHHPRARGWDTWFGYWHHANDYWQHTEGTCKVGTQKMKDLWQYNETFDGPATWLANGPHCSQTNQEPEGEQCVFEEELFTAAVKRVIAKHNTSEPLFLLWSLHLVHMPLQVPKKYEDRFSFIDNSYRRLNHAMGNYMDEKVGEVVDLLRERRIWNDALVVFHSDNGGEILGGGMCGGNNWPLRGGKFSNFEGGIRVNALVTGGILPEDRKGVKLDGLITGWDWYATYAALANVDPTDHSAAAAGLPAHDSINMWPWLSGANSSSPRDEIAIGDTTAATPNADGDTVVGGLISGRYKLLVGLESPSLFGGGGLRTISQAVLTGPSWPNSSSHFEPLLKMRTCGRKASKGCLFDIYADPSETTSISSAEPALFQKMLARIDELQKTVYTPKRGSNDHRACEVARASYEGYWGPFLNRDADADEDWGQIVV
eukprot:TRINITY_DN102929_c0_g1_i1.p1 TRINITY_DN102929_c0_g1~~TRINITY_DN102929_c0_g1_i1.p1  ORF type:complete len:576 (-),score=62.06 TRINITY_DN102929_c0_g1_i1:124-1851(-)